MTSAPPTKQPIRLLLLIPHLGGGGAERVVAQLARHLDPRRFEVHLGLVAQDFPGAEALPLSVQVHRLDCEKVRRAAPELLRLVRTIQPDVILSGMAHLNFLVLLLKPLLPRHIPILVRQNTTASSSANSWLKRLPYRYLYPLADKVICQSEAMADDLTDRFATPRTKLTVLANPIDIPTSPAESIHHPSVWPEDAWPRLLVVGRLSPEKGIDLLLCAMPSILSRFPKARAAVLGSGPEESGLRKLCDELHLGEAVTLPGHRLDLAEYYSGATLFIQPSRYEGMPNALLEAAAAGLPIVATPSSRGLCDLIEGALGTWLCSSVSVESLAETMLQALATLSLQITSPLRFDHAFLKPFATETAVASYASLIESIVAPAKPKHIAMVIPTVDAIGGAERQVILLARELAKRGNRVTIVALSGSGTEVQEEISPDGVAYLSLGMRKAWIDPRGWLRYLAWSRQNRPDVVHTHLPHATWFARWIRLLAAVRIQIDTIHTSHTGGRARQIGYRLSGFLSNRVTCVSSSVADAAAQVRMASRRNLSVLPNGVELPNLISISKGPQAVRPFRWIAVGRLAPVKDYPTLLRAFAMLGGEPQLEIVGSGPEEAHLRVLAEELGIANRVCFAGFQREIQPRLAAADAFVLASLWEGLPVGVLEASAAALPVVATDGPGTRETMLPGETGILVPVGDTAALAQAMAAIMALTLDQRRAMGRRGRLFVEERFSLPAVVDRWEDLYADLLQSHPRPTRWG